jgi:aryl-alcohol dehydrogenase-like predicted oxidoreductase
MNLTPLGHSNLQVPRLGVGAMTWGDATGLGQLHPSKIAYGGADGPEEEKSALEACLAMGVTLFDTAAMYGGGASLKNAGFTTRLART